MRADSRRLATAACALLIALCVPAQAQQPTKLFKIGFLGARPAASATGLDRLRQELSSLGYIEGKNIAVESRYADNELDRLPALADELVHLKVDVLLTAATPEALAAKKATRTIPIVFVSASDPAAAGLVDSLVRPGGNITGFTTIQTVLAGKRLEILKETIPKLSRVAVLWNPQDRSSAQEWKESQLPARELGLQLHSMKVSSADKSENESVFKEAIEARSAAVAITSSPLVASNRKLIADLAVKYRLPTIYPGSNPLASSGLMSYGPDRAEPYKRVAAMVEKILKGAKPADLPVEQPTKFELVINLKTAEQIRLTIPPTVLARADRVIR